jgi:endogenous inhibitor of DNA gyrase (YacG/DUF329 family)
MSQKPQTPFEAMPCPECGSQNLIQTIQQSEDVYVNENGDFENVEPRGMLTVLEVMCPECDDTIWSQE